MVLLPPWKLFSAALIISLTVASEAPDASLPVQSLIDNANALLAAGDKNGALDHFDAVIKKDPHNYLTLFKRGATYLSLGRSSQASADFDSVLTLKPDFEAALLQRARLKAKGGEWEAARADYRRAGAAKHADTIKEIDEAEEAANEAYAAADKEDWDTCVEKAGTAILVAQRKPSFRSLRAKCRLAKGDAIEAVGDLTHVAQLAPESTEAHLQISDLLYFSLNDYERSTAQLRKCLQSDPDSKPCSKRFRRIKNYEKALNKTRENRKKRLWTSSNKLLLGSGDDDDAGLIIEIAEDLAELKSQGLINSKTPQHLAADVQEMACENFIELKKLDKAQPYCDKTLELNPHSIPGVLFKASRLLKQEAFQDAINLLDNFRDSPDAEEASHDQRIRRKHQEAHTLLKRSKTKDYYKVLGVDREADERTIKRAYRTLIKQYHPDKYRGEMSKEEVLKKISAINEAWEVLSSEELKARFDRGDDPNDQEQGHGFQHGGHPFGGFQQQQYMFQQGRGGNPFGGNGFGGGGQGGGFKFQF